MPRPTGFTPRLGTGNGYAIAVFTEAEWQRFKQVMGSPSWAEDEKFSTLTGRKQNEEELNAGIEAWTKSQYARFTDERAAAIRALWQVW